MRKRNVQVLFRLNEEEAEYLQTLVKRSGRSKEALLRAMVKGYRLCEKPDPEFYQIMRELSAIGNRINQLAVKAKEVAAAVFDFKYNESRDASDFKAYCVAYMVSSRYGVDTRGFNFDRLPKEYAEMETQDFKGELGSMRDVLGEVQSEMYKSMEKNKPARNKEQER